MRPGITLELLCALEDQTRGKQSPDVVGEQCKVSNTQRFILTGAVIGTLCPQSYLFVPFPAALELLQVPHCRGISAHSCPQLPRPLQEHCPALHNPEERARLPNAPTWAQPLQSSATWLSDLCHPKQKHPPPSHTQSLVLNSANANSGTLKAQHEFQGQQRAQ